MPWYLTLWKKEDLLELAVRILRAVLKGFFSQLYQDSYDTAVRAQERHDLKAGHAKGAWWLAQMWGKYSDLKDYDWFLKLVREVAVAELKKRGLNPIFKKIRSKLKFDKKKWSL